MGHGATGCIIINPAICYKYINDSRASYAYIYMRQSVDEGKAAEYHQIYATPAPAPSMCKLQLHVLCRNY